MNLGAIKKGPARKRYEDVREPTIETGTFPGVSRACILIQTVNDKENEDPNLGVCLRHGNN